MQMHDIIARIQYPVHRLFKLWRILLGITRHIKNLRACRQQFRCKIQFFTESHKIKMKLRAVNMCPKTQLKLRHAALKVRQGELQYPDHWHSTSLACA